MFDLILLTINAIGFGYFLNDALNKGENTKLIDLFMLGSTATCIIVNFVFIMHHFNNTPICQ